jgi:hypothetical protein
MKIDRIKDWEAFSMGVHDHIRDYANKQYATDEGDEQIESWTAEDCIKAIQKYCARFGKTARQHSDLEQLTDLYKIAHYAQFAFHKVLKSIGG